MGVPEKDWHHQTDTREHTTTGTKQTSEGVFFGVEEERRKSCQVSLTLLVVVGSIAVVVIIISGIINNININIIIVIVSIIVVNHIINEPSEQGKLATRADWELPLHQLVGGDRIPSSRRRGNL